MTLMGRDEIVRALVRTHPRISRAAAERAADAEMGRRRSLPPAGPPAMPSRETRQLDPGVSAPILAHRAGDTLRLILETAPRTKKNHMAGLGRKMHPALKRYHDEIVEAIRPVRVPLALPLPPRAYNVAALFVVDRYGEAADVDGLYHALFDALQAAGVLADDWWFRGTDGCRVVPASSGNVGLPRVELTITPLEDRP